MHFIARRTVDKIRPQLELLNEILALGIHSLSKKSVLFASVNNILMSTTSAPFWH